MYTCVVVRSWHGFVSLVRLFLFFFRLPGNIKLGSNPTFYRSPNEYFSLLQKEIGSCLSDDGDEDHHRSVFELSRANSVSAYVKVKIQICKCDCVFVSKEKSFAITIIFSFFVQLCKWIFRKFKKLSLWSLLNLPQAYFLKVLVSWNLTLVWCAAHVAIWSHRQRRRNPSRRNLTNVNRKMKPGNVFFFPPFHYKWAILLAYYFAPSHSLYTLDNKR